MTFEDSCSQQGTVKLFAVSEGGYLTPQGIESREFCGDLLRKSDDGARYVVITHRDFLESADYLADARAESLSTIVVDVQQIYDEYSFGLLDPTAVKYFLLDAWSRWTIPPAYVVLLGDASYDFKNFTGQGYNN